MAERMNFFLCLLEEQWLIECRFSWRVDCRRNWSAFLLETNFLGNYFEAGFSDPKATVHTIQLTHVRYYLCLQATSLCLLVQKKKRPPRMLYLTLLFSNPFPSSENCFLLFSGANERRKQFQFHLTVADCFCFEAKRKKSWGKSKWIYFAVWSRSKIVEVPRDAVRQSYRHARLFEITLKRIFFCFTFRSPIILSSSDNKWLANVWGCVSWTIWRPEVNEIKVN